MNMNIPPIVIKDYLSEKFPQSCVAGREFRINSIFTEDTKQKLYINLDTGLWTDFKSNEKGNFFQLISHIENVPYSSARIYVKRLAFDQGANLFDLSTLNVENKKISVERTIEGDVKDFLVVHPKTDIASPHPLRRLASNFALSRKLGAFKFYVGNKGRYFQRIIIPYLDNKNNPFYFQARTLINRDPKYLNPSKGLYGIKTSEILYPYNKNLETVIVTEGPLDAMTLRAAGFNATCTQGCKMSTVQARELKDKKVVIAYDNDESGREGFCEAKKRLLTQRNAELYHLSPPQEFKDWNDFWVASDIKKFQDYVMSHISKANWELNINELLA